MLLSIKGGRTAARALAFAMLATGAGAANAAVFVFTNATAYTQNFDTLAASGTGTFASLPAGAIASETGTNANSTYAANTGSDNAGNIYSYGAAGSTDRALGSLRSGSLIPFFGFAFTNDTGTEITALDVAFTGEQWRLGTLNRADRLDFQYQIGTQSLTTGTFVDVNALDFVSPTTTGSTGAKNGNAAAFRTNLSTTISNISIADGQSFVFRFNDFDATGADDGLAIDDFSLTPTLLPVVTPVPEPATWAMLIAGMGLTGVALRRRKSAGKHVLA